MVVALLLAALQSQAPVVMTRDEAAGTSPAELEQRFLAGFPHRRILRVDVGEAEQPLSYVIFHEEAQPAGGRFCTARRIVVTFDSLDGKRPQPATGAAAERIPRRLFNVSAYPLLAVLDEPANEARCAKTTQRAQLSVRSAEQGRRMVEAVAAIAARLRRGREVPVRLTCVDETQSPHSPCNTAGTLAALDWKTLSDVDPPSSARGPTTQLRLFRPPNIVISLDVSGPPDRIETIAVRKGYPPPF